MGLRNFLLFILPALGMSQLIDVIVDQSVTQSFKHADLNKDGQYSILEARTIFLTFDKNSDNSISRQEYEAYADSNDPALYNLADALFDIYDLNHDDFLDVHDIDHFHAMMDSDGDFQVTKAEYVTYWNNIIEIYQNLFPRHISG